MSVEFTFEVLDDRARRGFYLAGGGGVRVWGLGFRWLKGVVV